MISNATQRAYDITIAMRVYGWREQTMTLVRGLEYKEKASEFPVKTGEKVMLVPANYQGDTTMWWHEDETPRDANVPRYTQDHGLAVKLMMRTARVWGWRWYLDMDETRCAIRLVTVPEKPEDAIILIGPFATSICVATIKALGIEGQLPPGTCTVPAGICRTASIREAPSLAPR